MKNRKLYIAVIAILLIVIAAENAWLIAGRRYPVSPQDEWDFDIDAEISAGFETALRDGSIEVWFQPIVDPATGEMVGAEALSRWRDGDGFISPSVFVSVLESTGQVTELDRNVLIKACEFQLGRLEAGKALFPISVNMSVASAMQDGIVDEYRDTLMQYSLPADCINIEVTESLDSDTDTIPAVVSDLREAGFRVEIDDFGAGYAAYSNLALITYDLLKIDKSLIDAIGTEKGDLLVRDLIGLAEDLGMKVIAEGVETEAQADYLRSLGCFGIQGYYYSKPLPALEFTEFLN